MKVLRVNALRKKRHLKIYLSGIWMWLDIYIRRFSPWIMRFRILNLENPTYYRIFVCIKCSGKKFSSSRAFWILLVEKRRNMCRRVLTNVILKSFVNKLDIPFYPYTKQRSNGSLFLLTISIDVVKESNRAQIAQQN